MMTTTDASTIPPIGRDEAERLARDEYARLAAQLRALSPDEWAAATDCPLWDVRAMAGHSLGMMTDFSSLRTVIRRIRRTRQAVARHGGTMVDRMTEGQVADQAALTTAELVTRMEQVGPRAARWRTRAPGPFRRMKIDEQVDGKPEKWAMGYLLDLILTRDPWMHRVDIARATGRPMELTAEHDGRIVADVVAEWARRHGRPFTLTLTGPAGGRFTANGTTGAAPTTGGEELELDAVEFCRILAGRAGGDGLLAKPVPF